MMNTKKKLVVELEFFKYLEPSSVPIKNVDGEDIGIMCGSHKKEKYTLCFSNAVYNIIDTTQKNPTFNTSYDKHKQQMIWKLINNMKENTVYFSDLNLTTTK